MSEEYGKDSAMFIAYDDLAAFDESEPEKKLLRAIIVSALSDIRSTGIESRQATQFFLSPEDDYVFSFRSICDYLHLDPKKILTVAGLDDKE